MFYQGISLSVSKWKYMYMYWSFFEKTNVIPMMLLFFPFSSPTWTPCDCLAQTWPPFWRLASDILDLISVFSDHFPPVPGQVDCERVLSGTGKVHGRTKERLQPVNGVGGRMTVRSIPSGARVIALDWC